MQPINFPGAREIGKPENMTDEQCFSVYAATIDYNYTGSDGVLYEARMWTEAWKPSKEDIEAINRGEPIYIQIHSIGLPPISVFTIDEEGKCNDAG
jgi:hypothetical protein